MNRDKLLAEAKKRYSIGDKIRSAYDKGCIGVLEKYIDNDSGDNTVSFKTEKGYMYFYYHGVWAEIISKPLKIIEIW